MNVKHEFKEIYLNEKVSKSDIQLLNIFSKGAKLKLLIDLADKKLLPDISNAEEWNTIVQCVNDDYVFCKEGLLYIVPIPDLKTPDGKMQYLTYNEQSGNYYVDVFNYGCGDMQVFTEHMIGEIPQAFKYYVENKTEDIDDD